MYFLTLEKKQGILSLNKKKTEEYKITSKECLLERLYKFLGSYMDTEKGIVSRKGKDASNGTVE